MDKLTRSQADTFVKKWKVVIDFCDTGWRCQCKLRKLERSACGDSYEAAITAYWQTYHKDWTPPVIHDAEWALRYAKKKHLTLRFYGAGGCGVWQVGCPDDVVQHTGGNLVEAIMGYKTKYDPDKPEPTREETAVELLEELSRRYVSLSIPEEFRRRVEKCLKEAAEGTAESPDPGGNDEGSTREQRLHELLGRLRNTMFDAPCELRREIDKILKEADVGADDEGGSDHD